MAHEGPRFHLNGSICGDCAPPPFTGLQELPD
jgi:hypothetical protein